MKCFVLKVFPIYSCIWQKILSNLSASQIRKFLKVTTPLRSHNSGSLSQYYQTPEKDNAIPIILPSINFLKEKLPVPDFPDWFIKGVGGLPGDKGKILISQNPWVAHHGIERPSFPPLFNKYFLDFCSSPISANWKMTSVFYNKISWFQGNV